MHIKEPEKAMRIDRSCGWVRNRTLPEVEKCSKDDTDFIKKTNCVCFKNGCNDAEYLGSSKIIMTSFLLIPFVRYYLYQ